MGWEDGNGRMVMGGWGWEGGNSENGDWEYGDCENGKGGW